jgi:transposase
LKIVDAGIERYLAESDKADRSEEPPGGSSAKRAGLQEKLRRLAERKNRCQKLLDQMGEGNSGQVSLSDSDSRLIKKTIGGAAVVGYNVQSAVDTKHHLIVTAQSTNATNDFGQLSTIAMAAKEELAVQKLEVLADGGYTDAQQIQRCQEVGIDAYVPARSDVQAQRGLFGRDSFVYDASADCYHCPGKQRLIRHEDSILRGLHHQVYYNSAACGSCLLRGHCTRGRFRKIKRTEGQQALDDAAARVKLRPEIYALRKAVVEHPFGTLKFWWGQGTLLLRGLAKVNAEVQLSALAYNFSRVLKILGVQRLLEHLKAKRSPNNHVQNSAASPKPGLGIGRHFCARHFAFRALAA